MCYLSSTVWILDVLSKFYSTLLQGEMKERKNFDSMIKELKVSKRSEHRAKVGGVDTELNEGRWSPSHCNNHGHICCSNWSETVKAWGWGGGGSFTHTKSILPATVWLLADICATVHSTNILSPITSDLQIRTGCVIPNASLGTCKQIYWYGTKPSWLEIFAW